ncbi:MAG: (d)CMP kinase [Nitrospiraceae bacterium]|nr:(d)CMP kinase [Nitrospiraceae bacterium]MDA8327184.1 (d)CMP kinase [Nitrospiraceae bacterium]
MGKVVAIDGPSGAGKSTVARALARALGFHYLDTGALYRAAALALLKKGLTPEAGDEEIKTALEGHDAHDGVSIEFRDERVLLNGEDVSDEIRTKEAGHYSSVFSARKPVREFLLPLQRKLGRNRNLVAEGRDMTTVVFPRAWKKFYLDASTEERARRRYDQLRAASMKISRQDAMEDVAKRDHRDSSRQLAPLKRSPEAVYLDTTDLSLEEVIKKLLAAIKGPGVR